MKRLTILTVLAALAACSDNDGARKALEGAGYSDIQVTGYEFTGCGENDWTSTGFRAKGPTGKPVEGVVCGGWPKGSTIRTN
ncbi:MAG: hypothetical protein ACXVDI_24485 [Ktedonobacterales bacterium]